MHYSFSFHTVITKAFQDDHEFGYTGNQGSFNIVAHFSEMQHKKSSEKYKFEIFLIFFKVTTVFTE